MNTVVRLCVALAFLALPLAHAGLETYWSQRFTSAAQTFSVQAAHFDPSGNVIVAGSISEANTGSDLWVVKLDAATGGVLWAFRKNGLASGNDKLGNIAISSKGDVFVAGGVVNEPLTGGPVAFDAYLAKLDASRGIPLWELDAFGNLGDDAWHDVALDADSNPVVTGVIDVAESSMSGQAWTAKFSEADGEFLWDQLFNAFETDIHDQGERLFIAQNGDVYVQGSHGPGTFIGIDYGPTVQTFSYTESGAFRWSRRVREGANARAYGFLPAVGGGFIIGLSVIVPPSNEPVLTIATGKVDGTPGTEVPLPGVGSAPVIRLAENDDILFTGREAPAGGPVNIVAGRLAPGDLSTHWLKPIAGQAPGLGTGFGHVDFGMGGSLVAGIAPGATTQDLALAPFTKDGANQGTLFLDGAASGAPVADQLPAGPSVDSDPAGSLVVASSAIGPQGEREVLVRAVRLVVISTPPTIALTSPDPANPVVEAFANFQFSVAASDAENDPISVEFIADGVSLGIDATEPFETTHVFTTAGAHTLEAIATDATGEKGTTGPITVTATLPVPIVTTGPAQRTGPATGAFSGMIANLPLGGTARFVFGFAGAANGPGISTAIINVPAAPGAQPVTIPFDIPEPHRSYDYFLEVTVTDGASTVTASGLTQTFTVPNAPVVPGSDFFFAPRGAIEGGPLSNDFDADPGEELAITYATESLPGVFVPKKDGFTFLPNRDFTGESILTYTVDDGHGSTVTETITLRNALHYAGIYRALPPVNSGRLGAIDVVVNRSGRATVAAFLDGDRYAARGELSAQGGGDVGFVVPLRKRSQPDRLLRLTWAADRQLTVDLLENNSLLYTAQGRRAAVSAFPVPQIYTLVGAHSNVSGGAAGRVSAFASLQLPPNGTATFRGSLGDGTAFVTRARVQDDGRVVVYTPLRGRKSSFLLGRFETNAGDAVSVAPGFAAVQGPATRNTPDYAAGYVDLVAFAGPLYLPPAIGGSPLSFTAFPRMMTLNVGGGFEPLSFSIPIWQSRTGSISGITGITRVSIDARTGELKGAFLPPGRNRTLPFSGILRPDINGGMGVFRGQTGAGEVALSPQ